MTGCTSGGYDQLETSPEAIEQELRPAVCERQQTDYSVDVRVRVCARLNDVGLCGGEGQGSFTT